MATLTLSKTLSFLLFTIFLSFSLHNTNATEDPDYGFMKSMDPNTIKLQKEKLSHFRLYWHDIAGGKSPTSVTVVQPPRNDSANFFGFIQMIDNPLTVGPDLSSKMVGRAQGFYASACLEEMGLLMNMNFVFFEGKYNGSTITVNGRNPVFEAVREMPVIGGSGVFRWAKGYAQARTHTFDPKSGDATVEYNVYVLHY